jgi:hypothetical protein
MVDVDMQRRIEMRAIIDEANNIRVWTNPDRRDNARREIHSLEGIIYAITSRSTPYEDPFAMMGGGKAPKPLPAHIQEALKPLHEKIRALVEELDSLVDKEATAIAKKKFLDKNLYDVSTM